MSYASWLELHLWFVSILLCVFTLHWCSYVVVRDSPKPLFTNLLCGSSAVAEHKLACTIWPGQIGQWGQDHRGHWFPLLRFKAQLQVNREQLFQLISEWCNHPISSTLTEAKIRMLLLKVKSSKIKFTASLCLLTRWMSPFKSK